MTTHRSLLGSIVIPAHNEEAAIGRNLRALLEGLDPLQVDVIVACNGCSDRTARIARSMHPALKVLDLPTPGKVQALQAAERETTALPRIYLDADVRMPGRAALAVLAALREGAVAARPPIEFDLSGCSGVVRRYFAARSRITSIMADLCGGGAYGFSAQARSRFGEFPDIIADDLFASRIVTPEEIVIVPTDALVVSQPRNLRSLLKIMRRSKRGNREFTERFPELARSTASSSTAGLLRTHAAPWRWPDAIVYAGVMCLARVGARSSSPGQKWERDDSSRIPTRPG
jgi:glycosyltransferase involved in cell wall biosynthesis